MHDRRHRHCPCVGEERADLSLGQNCRGTRGTGTARGSGVYYPELLTVASIKKTEGSYRANKSPAGDRVQELGMKQEMSGRNTRGTGTSSDRKVRHSESTVVFWCP